MAFSRRPATDADEPFLRRLHDEIRAPEFLGLPWTPEQLDVFLAQQWAMQRRSLDAAFPGQPFEILTVDAVPVGRLLVATPGPARLHLADIAVLAARRGDGIGSCVLSELCRRADEERRAFTLTVELANPARRWYERHGFVDDGESPDGLRIGMTRRPAEAAAQL